MSNLKELPAETNLQTITIYPGKLSEMKIYIALFLVLSTSAIQSNSAATLNEGLPWANNKPQPWEHFEEEGTYI